MDIIEQSQFIGGFFSQIWRIFLVESPCFGLTYADIVIGVFILILLSKIFKSIFSPDMSNGKDNGSGRIGND